MQFDQPNRREIITLVGGAAVSWPLAARAQQPSKLVRIGVLASLPLPPLQRFSHKLREYGYVEGQNLRFVSRFAEGRDDRYPALAVELAALPVDIIVTWGTPAAIAAKQATGTIPIVMGAVGDPVSVGIVSSLARPEGNITGFATQSIGLEGKKLELLKDLLPQLARVGILGNAANPYLEAALENVNRTAEQLRVALELVTVQNSDQIEGALLRLDQARPDAVLVVADTLLLTKRNAIVAALARSRLPAVYPYREYAEAGGLIAHGANFGVLFERAAVYVDRILKGARPADLPIQLATEFELIINRKAAAAIGLNIPPTFIARADEVIE
ncbi:MAG TPA: ABC transporter substrate-binding protein [Bradyrhizobium sp.]|uniref:ABC transporter substrate-binding protein n=1 Tax=Bradyrhizobium sp. TaxID=376 RepID=UPI002B484BBA|nr:ABC transporter substrate-binding protein [Bradyrhizobium sp.]HKO71902.1 ABC transporter substrate-binding protein [Bradyrhizobium sp.]